MEARTHMLRTGHSAPIRIGVVGGGLIAQLVHLPLLAEHPDRFATMAVVDPSRSVRRGLQRRFGIRRSFRDHRDMLEAGGLDAVLVTSPNGTHAEVVVDCLEQGLDVLVEKPLCLSVEDADRIIAVRDRSARLVQVGYMKRYDPAYEALIADLDAEPELRHITTVTHDPGLSRLFAPRDLLVPDDVGFEVADRLAEDTSKQVEQATATRDPRLVRVFSERFLGALVHDVNLVHAMLSELSVDTLEARTASLSPDGQAVAGTVDLANGASWTMAWMLLPSLQSFDETIRLYSADAIRTLRFPAPYERSTSATYTIERGRDDAASSVRLLRSHRESYVLQLAHFHDCIAAGAACRTPPEQARRDIALLTALFRHVVEAASDRSSSAEPVTSSSPPSTVSAPPVT